MKRKFLAYVVMVVVLLTANISMSFAAGEHGEEKKGNKEINSKEHMEMDEEEMGHDTDSDEHTKMDEDMDHKEDSNLNFKLDAPQKIEANKKTKIKVSITDKDQFPLDDAKVNAQLIYAEEEEEAHGHGSTSMEEDDGVYTMKKTNVLGEYEAVVKFGSEGKFVLLVEAEKDSINGHKEFDVVSTIPSPNWTFLSIYAGVIIVSTIAASIMRRHSKIKKALN